MHSWGKGGHWPAWSCYRSYAVLTYRGLSLEKGISKFLHMLDPLQMRSRLHMRSWHKYDAGEYIHVKDSLDWGGGGGSTMSSNLHQWSFLHYSTFCCVLLTKQIIKKIITKTKILSTSFMINQLWKVVTVFYSMSFTFISKLPKEVDIPQLHEPLACRNTRVWLGGGGVSPKPSLSMHHQCWSTPMRREHFVV